MKTSDKIKLAERIRSIEGLNDEERSALLGLLNESKTYGLVWEDKPEAIEERLRTELPVLKEVKSKAIISDNTDAPNHIIIEGDNLESLTTLAYTHEGKIDVIYIDPPYNTGKKDGDGGFVYNDSYVDSEDSYRHSKWLSFMSKRLRIAKKLLSEKGVIYISIGVDEDAQLKLLCNEIFGEFNKISDVIWQSRKSVSNDSIISLNHNYTLIYAKNSNNLNKLDFRLPTTDEKFANPDNDPRGLWVADPFDAPGIRPNLTYPIINPNTGESFLPAKGRCWRTTENDYLNYLADNRIVFGKKGNSKPQLKRFYSEAEVVGKTCISIWNDIETTTNGTQLLDSILGERKFNNPKPVGLIIRILQLSGNKKATILDFFAGSGTTLHSTMALNADDGGKRQCILCTNNENGICENVTYERNKRVINGYTKPNGEFVEGLHDNNLRYYRTAFVGRRRTPQNMRRLMLLASDMLCIKENLYTELDTFGELQTIENGFRYFTHGDKQMLVIYNEEAIYDIIDQLEQMTVAEPIIVYVFSPGNDAWNSEFVTVSEKVQLTALPSAIYNAYKRVLPKAKDISLTADAETDEVTTETAQSLFDDEEGGNE